MIMLQKGAYLLAVHAEIFTNEMLECLEFAFMCSNGAKLKRKRWKKNKRLLWLLKLSYSLISVILLPLILCIIENLQSKKFKIKT